MEHMLKYLPKAIQIYIPMNYIQSGDNYESVVKKDVIILKMTLFLLKRSQTESCLTQNRVKKT